MAADIGEGADLTVIAAHDDNAFTNIIEAVPIACAWHITQVADDLPARAKDAVDL